jgi:hypothetical protein
MSDGKSYHWEIWRRPIPLTLGMATHAGFWMDGELFEFGLEVWTEKVALRRPIPWTVDHAGDVKHTGETKYTVRDVRSFLPRHQGRFNQAGDGLRTSPGLFQYLVPIGEDPDIQEYEIKEGEAISMDDWRGEKKPERTYVMKDGDNLSDYLARAPV